MDNGSINLADIKVVPNFKTNSDLKRSIWSTLNSHLKRKDAIGNQPSQGPAFLVFRPTGRAGDEFKDHVTRHLEEGSPKYLIIASSTKPTATFGISEDDKKRLHRQQTRVVINQGSLVAPHESYHDYNSDSLKKLAEAICEDYSDFVEIRTSRDSRKTNKNPYCLDVMSKALKSDALDKEDLLQLSIKVLEEDRKTDEILTPVIPILKQYMDQRRSPKKKSKASGSEGPPPKAKKEPNAKMTSDNSVGETLDKKLHEHGQSGIKIKWLSIAETDMMMDSDGQFREDLKKKKKPEPKGFIDRHLNRSSSRKDSHGPVPEAIEKKKQGHSEIPNKRLSIVGQSVTDVEMASDVPESSSIVQTMASNTAVQVKAQEVGQRDQNHEPIMQEPQQDGFVYVPDGTEDEIVGIRATTVTCRFCGSSIHDENELVQCPGCHMKQNRMKSEWMYSLHFQKDPQRLYSVSSDVMRKCLEGRHVKENEIVNFLLTCGKIRYKTYNENDMAIGNEG